MIDTACQAKQDEREDESKDIPPAFGLRQPDQVEYRQQKQERNENGIK